MQSAGTRIGLDIKIKTISADAYTALFTDPKARAGHRHVPEHLLPVDHRPAGHAPNLQTGAYQNYAGYSDPEYDKLLEQAVADLRPGAAARRSRRAQQIAADQLLWIPAAEAPTSLFLGKRITGAPRPSPTCTTRGPPTSGPGDELTVRRHGGLRSSAVTLLVASFLFFSSRLPRPGRPGRFLLHGRSASPDALAAIRAQYHLDDPFPVQYFRWLARCCTATSAARSSTARGPGAARRPAARHPAARRPWPRCWWSSLGLALGGSRRAARRAATDGCW